MESEETKKYYAVRKYPNDRDPIILKGKVVVLLNPFLAGPDIYEITEQQANAYLSQYPNGSEIRCRGLVPLPKPIISPKSLEVRAF